MNKPKTYQDNFFEYHLQGAINSAEAMLPIVKEYTNPASVIDIGCGIGAWLSVWKKNGVNKVLGIDGEYVDTTKLLIDKSEFKAINLESGVMPIGKYDLVTCLEVAEHIPQSSAERFIGSLCALGNIILFSAAIPGQEGTMHVNEQYPEYWVNIFDKNGYIPIDCLRQRIWNDKRIQWWYRQNIMFFVRKEEAMNYPLLIEEYNATATVLALVHPQLYEEKNQNVSYYEKLLNSTFEILKYVLIKIFKKG